VQDDKAYQSKFLLLDHLGTTRAELKFVEDEDTGEITPTIATGYDYMPYGELISEEHLVEYFPDPDPRTDHVLCTGDPRDKESGLDYFGARFYNFLVGCWLSVDPITITKDRILNPQALNLYSYAKNHPIKFIDPNGMDVAINANTIEEARKYFNILKRGLEKADRNSVKMVEGNGKNGFQKGEFGIVVDSKHKSSSDNFKTVQRLSNDHSALAKLSVLAPSDSYKIMGVQSWSKTTGTKFSIVSVPMGHPDTKEGFLGYVFFQFRGKDEPGITYSDGPYTHAVINAKQTDMGISASIHHELRHVKLGDFGRAAQKALHGIPIVDTETKEAEKEAIKNWGD